MINLSTHESAQKFYDLFFRPDKPWEIREYLDNSFCDSIVEVDFNKNSFKVIFNVENKYYPSIKAGTFQELFDYVRDFVVHHEDRKIYADLTDPKTALERLNASDMPHFRFAHFRFKLQDGRYRYVEQAILTGEENGFAPGVARLYIFDIQNNVSRYQGLTRVESDLTEEGRDDTTGLYLNKPFFIKAQKMIDNGFDNLCIFTLDIESFRLFDEWYGWEQGDKLLSQIGAIFHEYVSFHGGVAGYFGSDDFGYFGAYSYQSIQKLYDRIKELTASYGHDVGFMPCVGIYLVQDGDNLQAAFERAGSAAAWAKKDFKKKIHVYNPKLQIEAEREFQVLLDFMKAMENGEITFFLQPQLRISTGHLVGAEALARWVKQDGTIVPPDVFVPALENHGFITTLDKYIWDKVCASLRGWLDRGKKAVPVSINVSRIDILQMDVCAYILKLCDKYYLPHNLIKIEITESAYAASTKEASGLVEDLHKEGFTVLMDDFGSGYSSLNTFSNLPVDVLKLDALFLRSMEKDAIRGMRVMESVVNMAKVLSLPIVVEGVETKDQVDYLVSIGIRYVQGFYYYKPLPISEFEALMADGSLVDDRGFIVKTNDEFRLREFLDSNVYSDAMLNNILGPVALYVWNGERVDIVRYNEQFYESVSDSKFHVRLEHIERFVPEEDKPVLFKLLKEAKDNPLTGNNGYVRFRKANGIMTTFHMHFYYLFDEEAGSRFYASVRNVTEMADLREQMDIIAESVSDSIVFMKRKSSDNTWQYKVVAHGLNDIMEMDQAKLQAELDDHSFFKRLKPEFFKSIAVFAMQAYKAKTDFAGEMELRLDSGKYITLEYQADSAANKANNVDFVITLRRIKKKK